MCRLLIMHYYGRKIQSIIAYLTTLSILSTCIKQSTCCLWREINSLNTQLKNKSQDYRNTVIIININENWVISCIYTIIHTCETAEGLKLNVNFTYTGKLVVHQLSAAAWRKMTSSSEIYKNNSIRIKLENVRKIINLHLSTQ